MSKKDLGVKKIGPKKFYHFKLRSQIHDREITKIYWT